MESGELKRLMRKKLMEYLRKIEEEQREKLRREKQEEEKNRILRAVMTESAYKYLNELRKTKKSVAEKIEAMILHLLFNGQLSRKVEKVDVMYLERKIEGKTGQIYVKSKEGLMTFSEFLRRK